MSTGSPVVHDQHPLPSRRLWLLLGIGLGIAGGVLAGWLIVG